MTSLELSAQMNTWKASITAQQRREAGNVESFEENIANKIFQNQPPTTVQKLEAYTLSVMKLRTLERIVHEMDVLNAYLDEIVQKKNISPDAIQSASYLMAMTMLDPQDLSRQAMRNIFKKIKIEQPISDHNSLVCYGKLKPSEEDVIAQTEALAETTKDTKGLLIAILMASETYKAKIVLLQQIRRNSLSQATDFPGNVDAPSAPPPQPMMPPPNDPNAFLPQPGMHQPQNFIQPSQPPPYGQPPGFKPPSPPPNFT